LLGFALQTEVERSFTVILLLYYFLENGGLALE
jgi:hypothetical protein